MALFCKYLSLDARKPNSLAPFLKREGGNQMLIYTALDLCEPSLYARVDGRIAEIGVMMRE
jgi:hypothetical protein